MKWRKISEHDIKAVLTNPERVEKTAHGRINAFRQIGPRYLKVTYRDHADELFIITAVDKSD